MWPTWRFRKPMWPYHKFPKTHVTPDMLAWVFGQMFSENLCVFENSSYIWVLENSGYGYMNLWELWSWLYGFRELRAWLHEFLETPGMVTCVFGNFEFDYMGLSETSVMVTRVFWNSGFGYLGLRELKVWLHWFSGTRGLVTQVFGRSRFNWKWNLSKKYFTIFQRMLNNFKHQLFYNFYTILIKVAKNVVRIILVLQSYIKPNINKKKLEWVN